MSYLDFELEIGPGSGREYPVTVVRSPAGEARETMHFPFEKPALENHLQAVQIALLRSGGRRRQVLSPEERTVQDFGRRLFNTLITGKVRTCYDVSLREAIQQDKGLRLKLCIQPPELAALPWEFMYDPRQAEYVCLSRNTPLVRYPELPQLIRPLAVTPPLHILGMVAYPRDLPVLDIAREKQRVEEATKELRANGLVELTWLAGQTWRDLQRAMRSGAWHIFHFIGHGGFDHNADEGFIALADDGGQTHRLKATHLSRLLADHGSLRLVLLNACEGARGGERDIFSSTAAILVRRGIPAVLAMQYEITDQAAIEFARAFYEALSDGMPVDAAVAEARKAVSLEVVNTVEWGAPVLYMRSPDGSIFDIERVSNQEQGHAERFPLRTAVLGSVLGFLIGVSGNLAAGWIQQDLFGNTFTLPWIVVIFLLSAAGLGGALWMQHPQRLGRNMKALIVATLGLAVIIAVISSLTKGMGTDGKNHPPDIQSLIASPSSLAVGQQASLTAIATDVDGDTLVYYWQAQKGSVPSGAQGDTITYTAPASSGWDTITVTVSDGDATLSQEIKLPVLAADASG